MEPAEARPAASPPVVFRDGLGNRRRLNRAEETLEVLCFRHELTEIPSFEFSLRERVSRLAGFTHDAFVRIRSVQRLKDSKGTLALISLAPSGVRLFDLLATARRQHVAIELPAALSIVEQLLAAIVALHEQDSRVAHGALGLERIIVGPDGHLVIAEHILGPALQQLHYSHERYWKELRILASGSDESATLDQRSDLRQIGVVALELLLGRQLGEDDVPSKLDQMLSSAFMNVSTGPLDSLPAKLNSWLGAMLECEMGPSFTAATEARDEFSAITKDSQSRPSRLALTGLLERCGAGGDDGPKATSFLPSVEKAEVTEDAETESTEDAEPEPLDIRSFRRPALIAAALVAVAIAGGVAYRFGFTSSSAQTGTLAITTSPAGAAVVVDGESRGVTPATLALQAGPHVIELRGTGESRTLPIIVSAGGLMSQYIELGPAAAGGGLDALAAAANSQANVDGTRGTTLANVANLTAGEPPVNGDGGVSPAANAPASGWISVSAPRTVRLYENDRLLGTSESERVMVPAGVHRLDLVNTEIGYRASRTVQVGAGKVASFSVDFPKGTMALNAVPWAEVWIDGEKVGDTPIGNLPIAVGPHEIIFRHPDLGEQRHTATVTLTAPVRISADLRAK